MKKTGFISAIFVIALFCYADDSGSFNNPIIDSDITLEAALDGVSVNCPQSIIRNLRLITVIYYSFDSKIHQGQILIDGSLVDDVQYVFERALVARFPIESVIPISAAQFRKNGQWDDNLSMLQNNTSAFNYRRKPGSNELSNHSLGKALDINPFQNPYIKGRTILPNGSVYNTNERGTLTKECVIVKAFLERGWTWGGDWQALKDYQHFEK